MIWNLPRVNQKDINQKLWKACYMCTLTIAPLAHEEPVAATADILPGWRVEVILRTVTSAIRPALRPIPENHSLKLFFFNSNIT